MEHVTTEFCWMLLFNYFIAVGSNYCDIVSVCLSFCLIAYLKNHTSKFHKNFSVCYWLTVLGPPLTAVRYVMYYRFCGWHHFHTMEQTGRIKEDACLVKFARWRHQSDDEIARWRHRWRSLPSPTASSSKWRMLVLFAWAVVLCSLWSSRCLNDWQESGGIPAHQAVTRCLC